MQTQKSLVIGPVIGRVTQDSARILAEFNFNGEVHCHLRDAAGNDFKVITMAVAFRPIIFRFQGLATNTRYSVYFDPQVNQVQSSFNTMRNDDGNLRFAVISCNEGTMARKKDPKSDLWLELANRAKKGEIDYAFHIGDQVYMDDGENKDQQPYQQACAILSKIQQNQWPSKFNDICELLRNKYRLTWGHKYTQEAMANVPNLTIIDDHEVRDDFGWRKEDYDPQTNKPDYFYIQCARQVYYEYQRSLRDDVPINQAQYEYWGDVINGVGIVALEYRAIRTWHRNSSGMENSQLGKAQLKFVNDCFDTEKGWFAGCRSAIVLSPLAFIVFGKTIVRNAEKFNNDVVEEWNYTDAWQQELAMILNLMKDWKEAKAGREITLCAGDIHTGGHTDIYYKGRPCFKQLIASAMNQIGPKLHEQVILKLLYGMSHNMTENYTFKQHDFTRKNNFGLVSIKTGVREVHQCQLIASENGEKVEELSVQSNDKFKNAPSSGCCSIF